MLFIILNNIFIISHYVITNCLKVELLDLSWFVIFDIYVKIGMAYYDFLFSWTNQVAEQLINPFGDDDEDFELNWLVDRHMKASFLGCDILMDPDRIPPMVKDYYWDKQNCPIPYTEASMHFKRKTYRGSAAEYV